MDTLRWDREAEAYASGLLETLPRGLAAPRCFGVDRHDGTLWIWLEDIGDDTATWDVERYAPRRVTSAAWEGNISRARASRLHVAVTPAVRTWSAYFSRTLPAILDDDGVWAQPVVIDQFHSGARQICGRCCASASAGRARSIAFR